MLEGYQLQQLGELQRALYVYNMNKAKKGTKQSTLDKMADDIAKACFAVIEDDLAPNSLGLNRIRLALNERISLHAEPRD
jgi:hypothetical protein